MRPGRAIFYLTFNGVHQNTNGIGRQTATMVGTVERHWGELCDEFGPTTFFVLTPAAYNQELWGVSHEGLAHVRAVVERTGGRVLSVGVPDDNFWSVSTWRSLCKSSADTIAGLSTTFGEILVVAVDVPFLHLRLPLAARRPSARQHVVHCPYSSYQLTARFESHPEREHWEAEGFRAISRSDATHVADVCRFMTKHLSVTYKLGPELFVPFESSVDLEAPEFNTDDESAVALVLARYGVPQDRPVVLAFGRAHPIKGFDILLEALQEFPERSLHVVIVAVPYPGDGPHLESLRVIAANTGLSLTFIDRFERALPRALSQWKNTRVVCCPSRVDTLPNVPMEVALWARRQGPIVIASDTGGMAECVDDGRTGFLVRTGNAAALRAAILNVLCAPADAFTPMRRAAYDKVQRERNQYENLSRLLRVLWSDAPSVR